MRAPFLTGLALGAALLLLPLAALGDPPGQAPPSSWWLLARSFHRE